jgi:hypothetical protein
MKESATRAALVWGRSIFKLMDNVRRFDARLQNPVSREISDPDFAKSRQIVGAIMIRPGFTRHFLAYEFRPTGGHENEEIYLGVSNCGSQAGN